MADLIAYTDLQTYLQVNTGAAVTFTAAEQTEATLCCSAASSALRRSCNRSFEIQGSAVDRYFTASVPYNASLGFLGYYYPWPGVYPFTAFTANLPAPILDVDDFFLSPTGTQVIGNITVTDYQTLTTYTPARAWPYNADSKGMPFTRLEFAAGTALPTTSGQLKVNCKYGWVTNIPPPIKNAALLQASRYFKRPGSPFGIAGSDALGNVMRLRFELDPDVQMMVADYRRWPGIVAAA